MKKNILGALKLVGVRLVFILLSVFLLIAFTWLITKQYGFVIYSAIVSAVYFLWIYNDAYSNGAKDKRYDRFSPSYGLVCGALSEIPSALLLVYVLISGGGFLTANIVYAAWQAPFYGFLIPRGAILDSTGINAIYFIVLLFVPVVNAAGYFIGGTRTKKLTPTHTDIPKGTDDK